MFVQTIQVVSLETFYLIHNKDLFGTIITSSYCRSCMSSLVARVKMLGKVAVVTI